jgi:arsenate reductase
MSVKIFGIRNCDTIKKAMRWLGDHGIDVEFHDYKKSGIDRAHLERWCGEAGWQTVLNRAGTTFRKLDEADRQDLDQDKVITLMLAQPPMIKRPVLEADGRLLIGFKPDLYERFFS